MTDSQMNTVEVEVRPFKHQVGGHTCVLEVTKSVICKPYVEKEVWFYENEPEELKAFTPKYLGQTLVTCDIQNDRKCLIALVPESVVSTHLANNTNDVTESAVTDDIAKRPTKKRKRSKAMTNTAIEESSDKPESLEAWSNTCIDRQINRYGFWANNQPQKFILLENLVHQYERPCLMDLKMGRRQFGDDSDEQKRKLLQSRCASSTSASLGLRICGSQVFNVKDNGYVFHDKYFGRHLDVSGAKEELKNFFFNGVFLRTDVIHKILKKLETLRHILLTQNLMFYSVSLLLLYDGAVPECTTGQECNRKSGGNNGVSSDQESTSGHVSSYLPKEEFRKAENSRLSRDFSEGECGMNSLNISDVIVDVRMIDFAHVSQKSADVDQKSFCSDETIVFGLNHLHNMLTTILKEHSG